ncbi:MAG: hypothetical protein KAG10_11220, partial [Methylococcales bacterium]|nr:hypothetical protein [Methylococcales bacterium]
LEAWEYLQANYPKISEHLESFAVKARKRGDKGYFWWELRSCAYYSKFENPKIQYSHFSPRSLFHFNQSKHLSNDKSYIIPTGDLSLYGLLNSRLAWFLILAICPFVRGGFYELRSQYIETLPIPKATDEQKQVITNLAKQCQQQAERRYQLEKDVRELLIENFRPQNNYYPLNKKLLNWWAIADVKTLNQEARKAFKLKKFETLALDITDPSTQMQWKKFLEEQSQAWQNFTNEIETLEQKINDKVYVLFNLTSDEIILLEKSIPLNSVTVDSTIL